MIALFCFFLTLFASPFKSKSRLEAENAALRHQLIVLQRKVRGRVQLTNSDRLFLVQLYRWFPSVLKAITIIRPETLVRWHRAGFRRYWRWKSRSFGGRPQIDTDLRALIRRMSIENPLWGAPRIHGELLKLGFEVAQSSVAKYMVKRHGPPSQGWRTFLRNHAPDIAAMDLFVAPTIGFDLLYGLVIIRLARRDLVWINVTTNPTAEWIARQITEAFPWDEAPHYLIRDRDRVYGATVTRRMRAMGIRDKPIAPASPWQNAFAERLIGSIRRECVDHIVVLGEAHLRRILQAYARYYNDMRTHRSLDKDGAFDLTGIAHVDRAHLHPQEWSHGLDGAELSAPRSYAGIAKNRRARRVGCDLPEQFRPLPAHAVLERGEAGALPPGRARLATKPPPTGSTTVPNTTGRVCVACSNGATTLGVGPT